jgi:hypothetical protein
MACAYNCSQPNILGYKHAIRSAHTLLLLFPALSR